MEVVFDIETNALLEHVTKVHCIVAVDTSTGTMYSFADKPGYDSIKDGLKFLEQCKTLIGHNILKFDIPVLQKLFGFEVARTQVVRDTLTLSRLIYPDLLDLDYKLFRNKIPTKAYGKHSLEAWGHRLGENKGDFGKQTDWQYWSESMQKYCEQDVILNVKLWEKLKSKKYDERAIELEHEFQKIIFQQEQNGCPFDVKKARELYQEILTDRQAIEKEIQETIPPRIIKIPFVPKRDNKTKGYKAGETFYKEQEVVFNPGSRQQIVDFLKRKYHWKPIEFTDKNNPKVDDDVLRSLPYPEAEKLANYLEIKKLCGQLAEGQNAWLKLVKNGKIHGQMITNGTISGRSSHHSPNLGQTPSVSAYKGKECRMLFKAPMGKKFINSDASGLELRMLAHYLAPYDGGNYARTVLEADIHTVNMEAAGLPDRNTSKRFVYSYLYGGGDALLGSLVAPDDTEQQQREAGREIRRSFRSKTPGLQDLEESIKFNLKKNGHLKGLDGRLLRPRSEYAALNVLLQGGGAVVCKMWNVFIWKNLVDKGLDMHTKQVLQIHDELSHIADTLRSPEVGICISESMDDVNKYFNMRCKLEAEYHVGDDWYSTH